MIQKNIFRNAIKDILLNFMLENKAKPGERISLAALAKELDVSVTPIREALTQLAETGIVTYKANKGFYVTELSKHEATDIYKIIALLEGEAIKNSEFSAAHIAELKKLNEKFMKSRSSKEKLNLDRLFHQKLIEKYPNLYAKKIIEDIRIRVFIYELEFMDEVSTTKSVEMHDKIISHLQAGKKSAAIKELKTNWEISIKHILNAYSTKTT